MILRESSETDNIRHERADDIDQIELRGGGWMCGVTVLFDIDWEQADSGRWLPEAEVVGGVVGGVSVGANEFRQMVADGELDFWIAQAERLELENAEAGGD